MNPTIEDIASMFVPRLLPEYMPHAPFPTQTAFLLYNGLEAFYGGAAGGGKLLPLDTPIPTPSGWSMMGDLRVGDQIFDEIGQITRVNIVHPIEPAPEAYRLEFDDGQVQIACADHRWWTYTRSERSALSKRCDEYRSKRRKHRPRGLESRKSKSDENRGRSPKPWLAELNSARQYDYLPSPVGSIHSTREISATLKTGKHNNHAIPLAKPLDLPALDLLVDPYVLGAWLGDGTSLGGGLTGVDPQIWEEVEKAGYTVTHSTSKDTAHYIRGICGKFRELGVIGNKHIPEAYLRASIEQRLALLQGLMDTDGTAGQDGRLEFTNTNLRIAEGAFELIASLGFKPGWSVGRARLNGKDCGPNYRINFRADMCVFRLGRKCARQKLVFRPTTKFRYIVSCEPCATTPMRCITVDSARGLYLCGRAMIPTHNSDALLMAALQYVDVPGYRALLLRRTYSDLALPDAIMARSHEWLHGAGARWVEKEKTYHFPAGSSLTFGFLEHENDKYRYQGSAYQFCGFDELTQFTETQYLYLFSRLRRLKDADVPIRMRAASNPPDTEDGEWVKTRFIDSPEDRVFISAKFTDNTALDQASYRHALDKLDPISRARLRDGDWNAKRGGKMFKREWFPVVSAYPMSGYTARGWDLAATDRADNPKADYTAGIKLLRHPSSPIITIMDGVREQFSPAKVETLIKTVAQDDGFATRIGIEQEPAGAGKSIIEHYKNRVLTDYYVEGFKPDKNKELLYQGVSNFAEKGHFQLLRCSWNEPFLDEISLFPNGPHDDFLTALWVALTLMLGKREVKWDIF